MPLNLNKIKLNNESVGFCRFKELDGKYLVTNDIGRFMSLTPALFKNFLEGKIDQKIDHQQKLKQWGFIKNESDINVLAKKYRLRNAFLSQGPSLHIIVVTSRCNHKCIYCQTNSSNFKTKGYDMSLAVAKKVVDAIFCAPSPVVVIEFQGGEPLMNWPVVKFITTYARKKNEKAGKKLFLTLVSNFSLLDKVKYNFLTANDVALSVSLDGPEQLHNKNRPWLGGNSYRRTIQWVKKIRDQRKRGLKAPQLGALLTISKHSLKYPKEIINEYLKWGFKEIHLRPLSCLGLSSKFKGQVGYSIKEFIVFWKKAMDYIIILNQKGVVIRERETRIMLQKILTDQEPNYAELRSPCGAATGQLVYNFDGKVYTCDEARMVGDETFLLGDVKRDNFEKIINHPTAKAICLASLLDNLPCDNCVYKPYCGVCPVQNYALEGNIFPQSANNERCQFHTFAFDYLFRKLENKLIRRIFEKWTGTGH